MNLRFLIFNFRFSGVRQECLTHRIVLMSLLAMLALMGGCGTPAGMIFPPVMNAPRWPPPPDLPRIQYIGKLVTSADLKPARSGLQALGESIFGKNDLQSMLTPFAICTDGSDRVFVADSNAQVVHVFNLSTRKYAQWHPSTANKLFSQAVGIAWDPAGRLLVSDSVAAVIHAFDTDGKYLGELGAGQLKRPCGITVHPLTGRIYVADSAAHQIVVLSRGGDVLVRIGRRGAGPGEFNFPVSVAIDSQGRLYVADALNFRVQQIGPDMKMVRSIGRKGDLPGSFSQPKCVAVDGEDHLYVMDNQFEAVQIFNGEGQLLLDFGEEGRGPGQFWLPAGIFIDAKNRIWIADSYNRRVQVFDYLSEVTP